MTPPRTYRPWQVAAAAAALSAGALLGPSERRARTDYRAKPQPPFAPPAWLFLPAWLAWKALAVRADTALLNAPTGSLPPRRRRVLLAARAADWVLWSTTQAVDIQLESPRLGLMWAVAQFTSTATVVAATRKPLPAAALSLAPQLAWLTFALAVGVGQTRLQRDVLWERLRGRF